MPIRLCDPYEPRAWARNWGRWDHHDFAEYQEDLAFSRGYQAGRESVYADLAPFIRWVLLCLPRSIRELDPDELADVARLLRGDIHELMARAIRHKERAEARAAARRAAGATEVFGDDPAEVFG